MSCILYCTVMYMQMIGDEVGQFTVRYWWQMVLSSHTQRRVFTNASPHFVLGLYSRLSSRAGNREVSGTLPPSTWRRMRVEGRGSEAKAQGLVGEGLGNQMTSREGGEKRNRI